MDRGKRPVNFVGCKNNKIYMDLKDIIREDALCFLPAKSVIRMQGVCRDWRRHILTPFFAHNQSLSFRTVSGLFCQTRSPLTFVSMDPNSCGVPDPALTFLPVPVDLRSSSNGLLCCRGITEDTAYFICNPVTKQWKKLPKPNADHGDDPAVVIVFEPSLLNFAADYKLICAFRSPDFDDATEFEIYSSKDGSWEVAGEICFASRSLMPRSGVHINGVVYWKVGHGGILAFDLEKKRSQRLQSYFASVGSLGMINGKLCTARITRRSLHLNVLINIHSNTMQMKSDSRMWKDTIIPLDDFFIGASSSDLSLLSIEGDILFVQTGKKIYSHDLKNRETKALCEAPGSDTHCVSYVNSLVSL